MKYSRHTNYRNQRSKCFRPVYENILPGTADQSDVGRRAFINALVKDARIKLNKTNVNLVELDVETMLNIINSEGTRKRILNPKFGFMYFVGYSKIKPGFIRVIDCEKKNNRKRVYDIDMPIAPKVTTFDNSRVIDSLKTIVTNGHLYALTVSRSAYNYLKKIVSGEELVISKPDAGEL